MTDEARTDVSMGGAAVALTARQVNSIAPSEWDYRTAGELAQALRARKTSASEVVEHTIARIVALDQRLNAIVVRDFESAREAAKAADAALARGEQRPLLGVPITIKESYNIAGLPTTWGVPQFKDFMPKEDALLVRRAKDAGAVILGKQMCHSSCSTGRVTTTSTERQAIPGTLVVPPEGPRAGRRRHWPPVLGRCPLARTSADRCACRRTFAASMRISLPWGLYPIAGICCRHPRHCSAKPTWPWSARWPEALPILHWPVAPWMSL